MKWYEGNIAEAVQKAKVEGAVFGVAIFGDDDSSKELEASLTGDEVQVIVNAGKFVCIRITGNSESHQQFAQIYTNAPSPSIYLIGDRGSPLEVISTPHTSSELKEKFQSAYSRHCSTLNASIAPTAPQVSPPVVAASGAVDAGVSATAQALSNANEAVRQAEFAVNQENLSMEDKIERAQRLAAAKREQKLAEEAEDVKRKERERRDMGKGLAELKRWQDEQEAKQLVEQRKKEKKDDQELRQRLREQIAQDRAARNARSNVSYLQEGPTPPQDEASSSAPPAGSRPVGLGTGASAPKDYSGMARLQFRLPSGSSISHAFEPSVTLGDVRTFLLDGNHLPFRQFTLSVAYPRRQFTSAEYVSTLRDLGLVPSAALLVLPLSGSTSSLGGGGSGIGRWISLIVSYLVIPFTFIYSLLQRALPSSGTPTTQTAPPTNQRPTTARTRPTPGNSAAEDAASSSTAGPSNQSQAAGAAELRNRKNASTKSGEGKKSTDGNIHRLRNTEEDSDEEKATWNGNSTQQM